MQNRKYIFFVILLTTILFTSCKPAPVAPVEAPTDSQAEAETVPPSAETEVIPTEPSQLEELLAFVPEEWIEQHPAEVIGPPVYYVDLELMSHDLGLPDVTGADSREDKLPVISGIETQNLSFIPPGVDPSSGSSYDLWGWDIADISQSLHVSSLEIFIMAGSFSKETITPAYTEQGFSSFEEGEYTLLADPEEPSWFAVSDGILLQAPSRDILETAIQQKSSDNANAGSITQLSKLITIPEALHGFLFIPSGDIEALSERLISEGLGNCVYISDWDYAIVAYKVIDDAYQIEIGYSFHTAQAAMDNIQLVQNTLTLTPSLMYTNQTWADLLTLNKIETDEKLVVVQASTARKGIIGSAIINRDYWGLVPLRKVDPNCRDIGE